MVKKHFRIVLCCFITSLILVCFKKSVIDVLPHITSRLSILPIGFIVSVFTVYIDMTIVYAIFKMAGCKKLIFKLFINEFARKYSYVLFISVICDIILNFFTDNKIFLNGFSLIFDVIMYVLISKRLEKLDFKGIKKHIILCVLFIINNLSMFV